MSGVCDEDEYDDDDKGLGLGDTNEERVLWWGKSDGVVGGNSERGQQSQRDNMRKRLVDGGREESVWELTLDEYISLLVSVFY